MNEKLIELANLYRKRKSDAVCLDIEVAGSRGPISVVGIFKPKDGPIDYTAYIRGKNLTSANLKKAFKGCKLLITYNGMSLDIPLIRKEFSGVLPNVSNLDLFTFAQKLKIPTDLAVLENTLGIERITSVDKKNSIAAKLWGKYKRKKDEKALSELIEYNRQDTINLYPIAEELVSRVK